MNLVRLGAACCALLFAVACGAEAVSDAAQDRLQPLSEQSTSTPVRSGEPTARPGQAQAIDGGLAVLVSAPKPFTPTDAASPRAARAVGFDLVIENQGTEIYRPTRLSVTAIRGGAPAVQVVDSTQGYTGLVGTAEEIRPGQRLRLAVAFALPAERSELRLTVQANAPDGRRVTVYEGTV